MVKENEQNVKNRPREVSVMKKENSSLIVESSCSKCISIQPQGPVLVCTLMGLTAGLHQQK